MSTKRSNRLGRGLSALIPDIEEKIEKKDIENILIKDIYPNENQPRRVFDEEKIKDLSESIKKYGVLQPIVLKPDEFGKYMIIAGERRYRASKMANLTEIPAVLRDIPIKEIMEIALIENLQREELTPIEEALGYKSLIENYKLTQEEISEAIGKSRPHIANMLRLLNLEKEVIEMINQGLITAGHGKALLRVTDKIQQINLANKIMDENLSVRETEELAKNVFIEKKKKKTPQKDIFTLDIEEKLMNVLGTKVNISKGKKKGKIEIEYHDDEQLSSIISLLIDEV